MLLLDDEDDGSGVPPSGGVMSSADSHLKIEIKKETECQSSAFQSPALVSSNYFRLGLYIIVVQFNIHHLM